MPDSAVRQQISREVKRALAARGLSARAAARRMGVEPKTLYRWINAEVTAPLDQLERFVEAVGPIRLELGTQKEAPPAGAEGALLARLDRLQDELTAEVRKNRTAIATTLAGRLGEMSAEILRRLPDERAQADAHQEE